MKHKDVSDYSQDNQIRETKPITDKYIVKNRKPYAVEDFLPNYSYDYDHVAIDEEASAMIGSLHEFAKSNAELVTNDYVCENKEAIIEGFQRAIAIVELYIKTMYLDE